MTKRPAVIFDRDGTLFSVNGPTQDNDITWENFNASIAFDAPVPLIHGLWHAIRPGIAKFIVSGRDGAFERPMRQSFGKYGIVPDAFFMRQPNDRRVDSAVKEEILDKYILPWYNVLYVFDDRPQVVEMWLRRGLSVLPVRDPKIDPPILRMVL